MAEEEDQTLIDDLVLGAKKKKKKKKKIVLPILESEPAGASGAAGEEQGAVPDGEEAAAIGVTTTEDAEAVQVFIADLGPAEQEAERYIDIAAIADDLDFPKRKKRRRPNITFEGFDEIIALVEVVEDLKEEGEEEAEPVDNTSWAGSDRDYTYDELLERVFNIMRRKNPSMVGGQKKKLVMKPPQVVRVGAKKTSFVNFTDICKQIHRMPKHLLAFLLAELGTSGSVDGNNQLIIKGRFQQKQVETVLRRYIKEYVTCHTCRSPDTILQKETRLFFLSCETCGSRCSVQSIKSGFQAVTGHRRQLRSKQQ